MTRYIFKISLLSSISSAMYKVLRIFQERRLSISKRYKTLISFNIEPSDFNNLVAIQLLLEVPLVEGAQDPPRWFSHLFHAIKTLNVYEKLIY